jgi:hypothetical protein
MFRDLPGADASGRGKRPEPILRSVEGLAVLALGVGSVLYVVLGPLLETQFSGTVLLVGVLAAFVLACRWGLHRDRAFLGVWVAVALSLGVFSVLTGRLNGLTDEPYATPAFVRLLPNLYGQTLHLAYTQYGTPETLASTYIYLPLLTLVQFPGVDYRWVALAAWLATVYLTRASGAAVLLVGSPFVGLLAANGFNDFVPFLVLTLSFVTLSGTRSRVAEVIALGLKQLANAVVVLYYLWHRRWGRAIFAVGVTVLFLLPFALLAPAGVVCHAILLDSSPACSVGGSSTLIVGGLGHLNYFAWVLWLLAIFGTRYVGTLRGPLYADERSRLARWWSGKEPAPSPDGSADWMLPLLPLVRLLSKLRRHRDPSTST